MRALGCRPAVVLGVAALMSAVGAIQDPGGLIGNRAAKTYHHARCELVRKLPARSRVSLPDAAAAAAAGFKACPRCMAEGVAPGASDSPSAGSAAGSTPRVGSPADAALRFSRDIAPILVGNCLGCHNPQQRRGEFDLSSFEALQAGSQSGPVIVPGKPDESVLVQLVVERKMPRGGNRRLSDEAIETIRRWVAEGARLDTSDPTTPIDQLAPSPEARRREAVAGLPLDERFRKAEAAGRERISKANPQSQPTATRGRQFLVLGELPQPRAERLLKLLDRQKASLMDLLGPAASTALGGPEPIGVYVLKDRNEYTEFVRSVEQREPELGVSGHARLTVENPYLVAIDPLAGGDEPEPVRATRGSRRRKPDDASFEGPERGLGSIVAEALAAGTVHANPNAPRWLAEGLGALAAAQVEPTSPYLVRLRNTAVEQLRLGGAARATEVLGDQGSPEAIRALGFSLCDCLATIARPQFASFVSSLAQGGGEKLDEIIRGHFGPETTREQFLNVWGEYVAARYLGR
ncbi:MAG: hypothetical protein KatS3mg108_2255 [Isosphaeraceae bacterium]|nr:MAG: hypothetical protein KatS3mg108_2255 [Isosphaeraceae bacterium]